MGKHRKHRADTGWRRWRVTARRAVLRPLALVGATAALAAGTMAGGGPASAASASAMARPPVKSAAVARAGATGHLGLRGGQGSGNATGRGRAIRTATPPVLSPAERRVQREAARRPALVPGHVQGQTAAHPASPSSPALAAARPARPAAGQRQFAPADFNHFRAQNVSPGNFNSGTNEPSVANDGNDVLYTGNWYAAQSTDSGHTFRAIDPFNFGPAPTLPNGGFCCDQVAIHAPSAGITAWGLLYCPASNCDSGDNLIRLAVARNKSDLDAGAFDFYDFSAQTFGFPEGDWLDYPHFGVNAGYLMLTMNVFNGSTFQDSIMVRFDLAPFLSGNWSAHWVFDNQDFTWTPTDNSTDTWSYWGATAFGNGSLIRVYNWPPNTDFTHVSWNDFSVNFNSATQNGSCAAPDGNNWCAFDDSRVKTGGEVGSGTVYFMWDAKQGGGFPLPYVDYAFFDVSTGPATSVSEHQIWSPGNAWAFPGMGVNGRGALGVSLQAGGGSFGYPSSQFLINDDVSGGWSAQFLDQGTHANNRWGDYLTARAATTGSSIGDTWLATGYTLHDDGFGDTETFPSFYWVGRNRDDPFAPSWTSGDSNSDTEGVSVLNGAGVFAAPSNCACDYTASVQWGDGTSNVAFLGGRGPGSLGAFGPHAYAEEGSYTSTTNVTDNWGATTSGTSSASVADAGLTAHGRNITGAAGATGPWLAATFTDADPGGTQSDYRATIHWGDGTSSPGTVNRDLSVTGRHTYARTGTFTVTTTITDAGGATATATSHASIGLRPAISSVSPSSGSHAGGQSVTITGAHFTGVLAVQFGNIAGRFTVKSGTKIIVITPPHAAGTVDIRVITKFGASAITSHDKYKFT